MTILKESLKWLIYILAIPVIYFVLSFILTTITVDKKDKTTACNKSIFLHTNGLHLDIILSKRDIDPNLKNGIKGIETTSYISFGWGDKNFYINTPTWADLTFGNAFQALFLESTALMHTTRYRRRRAD